MKSKSLKPFIESVNVISRRKSTITGPKEEHCATEGSAKEAAPLLLFVLFARCGGTHQKKAQLRRRSSWPKRREGKTRRASRIT